MPATISGRLALASTAATAAIDCGLAGAGVRSGRLMLSASAGRSISASCTLVGRCRLTEPPAMAVAAASASTARTDCGLVAEKVRSPAALSTPTPSNAL